MDQTMNEKKFEKNFEKDFKEGLSITCEIDGKKIDDAKLHFESGKWWVCQNKKDGFDCNDKLGYKYSYTANNHYVTDIQLKHRTLDDLQEGDIVINKYGDKRKCLGVCGMTCHLSYIDDRNSYCSSYTLSELKKSGHSLLQEDPYYYWFISDRGVISKCTFINDDNYKYRLKSNNVFQSKEEATAKLKEVMK